MTVELEWRFGDETPDKSLQKQHSPRHPRWRVCLGLGGMVLLLAVGLYGWWRVRREALVAVEAEVRAVAKLELRALAKGDTELYLSLQDGTDPNWQEAQKARAELDTLFPPPLPGLTAMTAVSVENARVVGDVARVEVVRVAGLPSREAAPFRAIRFYRHSDDGRWLHTRADMDYAGHPVIFIGQQVKIISFATDRGWVAPIAPELEGLAERFCNLVSCQQSAPLTLVFTGMLDTAVETEDVLPALFLVGTPDDEAARVAWEATWRELLVDRLIAREVGESSGSAHGEPHDGELFYARLREWMRAELGLSEPVSPDLDLIGEALDAREWISLRRLWDFTLADDAPRQLLAEAEIDLLLAFIEEEYGPSMVINLLYAPRDAPRMEPLIWEALHGGWPAFENRYVLYARKVASRPVELPRE